MKHYIWLQCSTDRQQKAQMFAQDPNTSNGEILILIMVETSTPCSSVKNFTVLSGPNMTTIAQQICKHPLNRCNHFLMMMRYFICILGGFPECFIPSCS